MDNSADAMVISLDIIPFEGAIPVRFGIRRTQVIEIMGMPDVSGGGSDSWGPRLEINIGYDQKETVDHVGLSPGSFQLKMNGQVIWTPTEHPDPVPTFLRLDPEPLEHVGFLVFTRLGIKTTGFHDDCPDERAIALYPKGGWDKFSSKAKKPKLEKYSDFRRNIHS